MNWVAVTALISFVIGLIAATAGLKSLRSKTHEQAEISWKQPPLSPWRYETLTILALSIHSLGLICLTAIEIWDLTHNTVFQLPAQNPPFLLFPAAWFALFFTTYASGVTVAYHLAQPWIRPISYGISGEGMWYGGTRVDWESYSHYEVGPDDGMISLYSSYSPALRSWAMQPPGESFPAILGIMQKYLPSSTAIEETRWHRSPLALNLGMTALVILVLLPALWGWMQNQSWVWLYAFVAFLALQFLGMKLITRFDGR